MNSVPAAAARFELACTATRDSLPALLGLVDQASAGAGLDPATAGDLRLAVEEACANVIMHGYAGLAPGPIRLAILCEPDRVVAVVEDEARLFAPACLAAPDLEAGLDERPIGGLGWHLIRQVMDEVAHFAPPGGGNVLTLTKYRDSNN